MFTMLAKSRISSPYAGLSPTGNGLRTATIELAGFAFLLLFGLGLAIIYVSDWKYSSVR